MNWVLLLGDLIPLWTAFMIIYMNRSTRAPQPVKQVEAPPEDDDYDYEPAQEKPSRKSPLDALRGLSLGRLRNLRVRLPEKKEQSEEAPPRLIPHSKRSRGSNLSHSPATRPPSWTCPGRGGFGGQRSSPLLGPAL
ncbi:hypothetical protein A3K69_06045 [Candidatus Bathyarchaeota archaeon RBG_16_57_9]|nr:MAG: hypothetical protein A3K69_06045 [Candidatus Bathyarchaeota archaeon RBG_16_57_9]OGD53256.1 MAG: hypothetical protein A3K81_02310 [Candidatus Bathyarchaeota archaeon RBG_13_60_20]